MHYCYCDDFEEYVIIFTNFDINNSIVVIYVYMCTYIQFLIGVGVMSCLVPRTYNINWIVGAGLAQISEFAFVLGVRGQGMGLISREVCYLICTLMLFLPKKLLLC